jgi:SulP family sulfate permease
MASRMVMVLTMVVTLFLPMHVAVFIGVVLSVGLFVYDSGMNVRIVSIVVREDGAFVEQAPPEELPSDDVTLLHVYGTVFFAAAYSLEQILPSPLKARRAVAIVHLRGYEDVGSTFIGVMERYAQRLQENGGRLLLSGVSEGVKRRLDRTETTETIPEEDIFLADPVQGASTRKALQVARAWLEEANEN